MTYLGKFNKLLRRIWQLETNEYYSNAQILDQFIAGLKDKLIKKVHPHAPKDLATAIQQTKNYEIAMEEANHTKLVNLAIGETSLAAEEKIDQLTKKNFCHTALSEGRATAQQQNSSYAPTTIPPARIAKNANLSDIFPFEFEANKSPFLLSNAAANEQKAITAMYTKAEVEGEAICLILDNGSARSIITYQNVDRPAQTVIITANGMKKTPVEEIDNFLFTLDGITIPVKVLIIDALQYQALTGKPKNYKSFTKDDMPKYLLLVKAPVFKFEEEEEKPVVETFMALRLTSNWAEETEQTYFATNSYPEEPETSGWNIPYSKPEPKKQCPYIPLKCKDCHKKLSSIKACISPEEEYESHTCYYCKDYLIKRNGKWDGTLCFTCGKQLSDKCNWIDVVFRGGVCDQTCQYALFIAEKIKHGTPFNAAYNSVFNKLYHYPHDAKMIYELAMVLINGGTKENVLQMKEAEYIEYTLELAGFNYKDKIKVYHQIANHIYPTQEAQIQ
ncbi:hypothetical protein G9A89_009952 [Geosiphon pyriformis]|nr:hypothetical protein G9A89_009952 [Geosiphon pyriformis]